jgi:transcriptional regulator NrdR family protein
MGKGTPVVPTRIGDGVEMARQRVCPQCQEGFTLATTGRPPTYCSASCRKAAWDARRLRDAVDQAVQEERQRANRGNETGPAAGNRGNETAAADDGGLWPAGEWDGQRP